MTRVTKITVVNEQVLQRLGAMELATKNLSGLMMSFGEYMKGSVEKNFAVGGRPNKWSPLKFATKISWHIKRKSWWTKSGSGMTKSGVAAWAGRIPLTDTARLRRSITYLATANSIDIGTNVVYAAPHQWGWPKKNIPARPYLIFQAEDLEHFKKMAVSYVASGSYRYWI